MSVLFTTVYSGVALNTDLTKGVVDRFRSLPIWRAAPLVGAVVGDRVRYVIAGTVVIIVRLRARLRGRGRLPRRAGRARPGGACSRSGWRGCSRPLGLLMRSPNAVLNAGFMALFPLHRS